MVISTSQRGRRLGFDGFFLGYLLAEFELTLIPSVATLVATAVILIPTSCLLLVDNPTLRWLHTNHFPRPPLAIVWSWFQNLYMVNDSVVMAQNNSKIALSLLIRRKRAMRTWYSLYA